MNETEEYFLCDKNIENASYSSSKKRDCEINFHVKYSSFFDNVYKTLIIFNLYVNYESTLYLIYIILI